MTPRLSTAGPTMRDAVGNTPVAMLQHLVDDSCGEVWVKLEAHNPTGSYKDRMAHAMIEGAERAGRLRPGQTIVEYSSGSTGAALASACAVTGHPLVVVSSDAFTEEKNRSMRAFGARVDIISSPTGITPELFPTMMARAAQLVAELDAYPTDQFRNVDMLEGYRSLAQELYHQMDGRIDAFCAFVGTAGCFLGTTRELRHALPALHRVVVEPAESPVISENRAGTHRIEGGGAGFRPPQLHDEDFEEVITVAEADAFEMARRVTRQEGIFSGPSTGANLTAALRLAQRLGPGSRVATVQVDSGLKYLSGDLYT